MDPVTVYLLKVCIFFGHRHFYCCGKRPSPEVFEHLPLFGECDVDGLAASVCFPCVVLATAFRNHSSHNDK